MTEVKPAMNAAVNLDDEDGLFEVVVETRGTSAAFELPAGWRSENHVVHDFDVQVVYPLHSTKARARSAIVTLHDIGMNAPMCFGPFFSYCRATGGCLELDTAHAHYHLSAPGHLPDSPPKTSGTSFEITDLARGVLAVLERFELRRVVGLGFGVGAAVLCQAALESTTGAFAGLIAVSPVLYSAGIWERTFSTADALAAQGLGLGRRAKDKFLERWLAMETRDSNHDLVQAIEDELDRMCPANVAGFLSAEARRPDLSTKLRSLPKTLLITGRESPLRHHVEEGFSQFDPTKVTWLDVMEKGSFVHEEAPERVAKALALYLQGLIW